jgi:hypothetical protein
LLFAGFGFTFLLFIFELAEIHDFTNGRFSIWGDFHQIQSCLICQFHCAFWGDHPNILALCANQANFGAADTVVDARASVTAGRRVVGSAGYGFCPSVVLQ